MAAVSSDYRKYRSSDGAVSAGYGVGGGRGMRGSHPGTPTGSSSRKIRWARPLECADPPFCDNTPKHRYAEAPVPILKTRSAVRQRRSSGPSDAWTRSTSSPRIQSATTRRAHAPVAAASSPTPSSSRRTVGDLEKPKRTTRQRPPTPHRRRTAEDESEGSPRDYQSVQLVRDQPRTEFRPKTSRDQAIRSSGQALEQRRVQSASSAGSRAQQRTMAAWGADSHPQGGYYSGMKPKKVSSADDRTNLGIDGIKAVRRSTTNGSTVPSRQTAIISERQVQSIPWDKITSAYKPLDGADRASALKQQNMGTGSLHRSASSAVRRSTSAAPGSKTGRSPSSDLSSRGAVGLSHMNARRAVLSATYKL